LTCYCPFDSIVNQRKHSSRDHLVVTFHEFHLQGVFNKNAAFWLFLYSVYRVYLISLSWEWKRFRFRLEYFRGHTYVCSNLMPIVRDVCIPILKENKFQMYFIHRLIFSVCNSFSSYQLARSKHLVYNYYVR